MRSRLAVIMTVVALALVGLAATGGAASAAGGRATKVRAAAAAGSPIGSLDSVSPSFDDLWVLRGWAADPDGTGPVNIHIYVGSIAGWIGIADQPRPDVAAAVPWAGASTGFERTIDVRVPMQQTGSDLLCAYAYNQNAGHSTSLGCRHLNAPAAPSPFNPFGHIDAAVPAQGLLRIVGWVGDPGGAVTTRVRIYDNGVPLTPLTADQPRPDVQAATGLGPWTGFNQTVPVYPGSHTFCLYAENTGLGTANTTLGCVSRTDPGKVRPGPHDPRGDFGPLVRGPCCFPQTNTAYHGRGWAFDPDTSAPVDVVLRFWQLPKLPQDGIGQLSTTTGLARPDVQASLPGAGPNRGFEVDAYAHSAGYVVACAYAQNVGPGTDRLLGCSWGVWA